MIDTNPLMWRKGLTLSATFLFAILLMVSCKKKDNQIGQSTIYQDELLISGGVDTFSLQTYMYTEDSVISDNPAFAILGSLNDPTFGTSNSEIYTQLRLSGLNPDFGDLMTISIDSVVLGLEYAGFYGNDGTQTVEVYEINDTEGLNLDSTYYTFSTKLTTGIDLVDPTMQQYDFNTTNSTVIGSDTVNPQLRIFLDTNFAWQIMNQAALMDGTFDSNENFLEWFKGFHIKTNNGLQSPNEGGLFYFNLNDPLSKLTIYYTQDGEQKTYDLVMTSESADFNHVDVDNTGTNVQNVITDSLNGMVEFYAQSFRSRAKVDIPSLTDIPANAVIHKAILELPIQYQTGSQYLPGLDASVTTFISPSDSILFSVGSNASFDAANKQFVVDVRSWAQAVVNGEVDNNGLVISPILFITSGDRIVFNGPNSTNKAKPKLTLVYTEF